MFNFILGRGINKNKRVKFTDGSVVDLQSLSI